MVQTNDGCENLTFEQNFQKKELNDNLHILVFTLWLPQIKWICLLFLCKVLAQKMKFGQIIFKKAKIDT